VCVCVCVCVCERERDNVYVGDFFLLKFRHHDLNTSELVKDLSNKQSESAYLYTDSVELLGKNSWNIRIEEKISLQVFTN